MIRIVHLYYDTLNKVQQDNQDLTEWLEYFVAGVATSIKPVKERVLAINNNVKTIQTNGKVSLNDRQMKIIEKIIADGKIANKDIREMFSITQTPTKQEISNFSLIIFKFHSPICRLFFLIFWGCEKPKGYTI